MKKYKFEVFDGDTYLFSGSTAEADYTPNEEYAEFHTSGMSEPVRRLIAFRPEVSFVTTPDVSETFKRYIGREVRIVIALDKLTNSVATGRIADVFFDKVTLTTAKYDIVKEKSEKVELMAQLDELKRKIEEAFE